MTRRILLFTPLLALPLRALAAAAQPFILQLPNFVNCPGGQGQGALCVVELIIIIIFNLAIPVTVIMVIWGGFLFMTSEGNPEKVSKARDTILYAAIGFGVILLSGAARGMIEGFLGP